MMTNGIPNLTMVIYTKYGVVEEHTHKPFSLL